ncbi:MAG: efflux RND transporter permease subunit, partial [Gemmataceae bacterium]
MSLRLSDLSIRNPVFAVMVSFALVIFGWMSYRTMGISQFPEVDFPVVSVVINREAAPPEIMDGDVSDVVEDAIASVEGVDSIQSQSSEGTSIVTVYFKLNRDVDAAMQDVQNAVASARRRLPVDIDPPIISKVNPNNLPVIWLTLAGPFAPHKLSDLADRVLKSELSSLYGVGGIQFAGLQARSMRLWIDPERLEAFALTAEDIRAAIQSQHAELPAGYIKSNQVEFNLRTMGEASNAEEFRRLVVARRNDQTIHLGDVAILEDGGEDRRSLARFNRLPA